MFVAHTPVSMPRPPCSAAHSEALLTSVRTASLDSTHSKNCSSKPAPGRWAILATLATTRSSEHIVVPMQAESGAAIGQASRTGCSDAEGVQGKWNSRTNSTE